jgi:hypothetical protein
MRDLGGFWVPVFKGGKPYTLSLVYFGIYTLFYFMFSFLLLIISVCVWAVVNRRCKCILLWFNDDSKVRKLKFIDDMNYFIFSCSLRIYLLLLKGANVKIYVHLSYFWEKALFFARNVGFLVKEKEKRTLVFGFCFGNWLVLRIV